ALGDDDVRAAHSSHEQQSECSFATFAADAIGSEQRHENPDRIEHRKVEVAKELAANTGFKTIFDAEEQARQQQRPSAERPQVVREGVSRRSTQFTVDYRHYY